MAARRAQAFAVSGQRRAKKALGLACVVVGLGGERRKSGELGGRDARHFHAHVAVSAQARVLERVGQHAEQTTARREQRDVERRVGTHLTSLEVRATETVDRPDARTFGQREPNPRSRALDDVLGDREPKWFRTRRPRAAARASDEPLATPYELAPEARHDVAVEPARKACNQRRLRVARDDQLHAGQVPTIVSDAMNGGDGPVRVLRFGIEVQTQHEQRVCEPFELAPPHAP